MASSVFFKFKSQKEPQRVTFDGTGISVFELKREIINISRLGDGTDFDLLIYNEDNTEEYDDDTTLVPRSTSVIARRLPAARPGQGRAARYVSGRMPVSAKNAGRLEQTSVKPSQPMATATGAQPQTEEEKIEAMFKAQSDDWERQKQQMASAQPGSYKPQFKGTKSQAPDHPPPVGYICYRCGEKGHWIQACPTNNDPTFDGRPRVKRTTGIPRSMLQAVEKPSLTNQDEEGNQPAGVMVNAEGEFVVAVPDTASWQQFQAKAQASAQQASAAAEGDKQLRERGLECPIDKRLFVDPMKTPCCERTYCNECIENALLNSDLVCPGCNTEGVLLDNLVPDEEMVTKIKAYEEEKKAEKKAAEKARSTSPNPASPKAAAEEQQPDAAAIQVATGGKEDEATASHPQTATIADTSEALTEAAPSETGSDGSKKRKAEEELSNDHKPEGPGTAVVEHDSQPMQKTASTSSHGSHPQTMSPKPPTAPRAMQQQQQRQAQMGANGFTPDMMRQMNAMAQQTGMPFAPMGMNPMIPMNPAMMQQMQQQMMMMQQNMMPGMFPNNFNNNPVGGGGFQQGRNWFQGQQGMTPQFNQQQGEDDNAYMRKPVNPNRNYRQKKARPVDYREL